MRQTYARHADNMLNHAPAGSRSITGAEHRSWARLAFTCGPNPSGTLQGICSQESESKAPALEVQPCSILCSLMPSPLFNGRRQTLAFCVKVRRPLLLLGLHLSQMPAGILL